MMINKENYEIFAIDFLDDNLDKETRHEMVRFLNDHPEIKAELEIMMKPATMIADETITFEPKSLLKKEEKERALWLPVLLKYASAIALLLSIGLVWQLNNKSITTTESVATNSDSSNNVINKTTPSITINPNEEASLSENKESAPAIKDQPATNNKIKETPKQINTPRPKLIFAEPRISEVITEPSTKELIDNTIADQGTLAESLSQEKESSTTPPQKRRAYSMEAVDLYAYGNTELSNGTMKNGITIPNPPSITLVVRKKKTKGSWILDAITKKSDGTNIFAFEGVKRALTPTRLRDVNVDKTSTDSPFKQFTND